MAPTLMAYVIVLAELTAVTVVAYIVMPYVIVFAE